jgi:hypothetical protein
MGVGMAKLYTKGRGKTTYSAATPMIAKLIQITFAVVMVGFAVFYGEADWANTNWTNAWYLWTDISFLLLAICLYFLLSKLLLRKLILILIATYSLRIVWDIVFIWKRQ